MGCVVLCAMYVTMTMTFLFWSQLVSMPWHHACNSVRWDRQLYAYATGLCVQECLLALPGAS